MSNSIIRNFSVNPSQGFVTNKINDKSLYVNMILNKRQIVSKNVKYVKICVVKTSELQQRNNTEIGYEKFRQRNLERNNSKIKQFLFEDLNVITANSIESDFQDFTFYIPYANIFFSIFELVEGVTKEMPHTFKIYFLNSKKNIVENYTYQQLENVKLENYANEDFDDQITNLLFQSIDIDFKDYVIGPFFNYTDGPSIIYNNLLDNFDEFQNQNVNLKIYLNEKEFVFTNLINFKNEIIDSYKEGLIFSLFEVLKEDLSIEHVELDIVIEYENSSFAKIKRITKNKILNLYATYFAKYKFNFIKDAFKDKIEVDVNKIVFTKPDLYYFLTEIQQDQNLKKISIKVNSTNLKLYTSESLSNNFIVNSSSEGYDFNLIYNGLQEEQSVTYFFDNRSFDVDQKIIVKFLNYQVYPDLSSTHTNRDRALVIPNFFNPGEIIPGVQNISYNRNYIFNTFSRLNLLPLPRERRIDTPQDILTMSTSFNLNKTSKTAGFISQYVVKNIDIVNNLITGLIDFDVIRKNQEVFGHLEFNTNNNDYLETEVFADTIVKYSIKYSYQNSFYEITKYCTLSDISEGQNLRINDLSNIDNIDNEVFFSIEFVSLPKDMFVNMISGKDVSDDEKEKSSKFLIESFEKNNRLVNDLIDKVLYSKSQNIGKTKKISQIFNLTDGKYKKHFNLIVNKSASESVIKKNIINANENNKSTLRISKIKENLENIEIQNKKYKRKFKSFTEYGIKNNSLRVTKKKSDQVIAKFDLTSIFKDFKISLKESTFNVSMMMTLRFDPNTFTGKISEERKILQNQYLLDNDTAFYFYNLRFKIKNNVMYILCPSKDLTLEFSESSYYKFYELWGQKNSLYMTHILERYCIQINTKEDSQSIALNNFTKRDYETIDQNINKNYLLNSNLHMPNIELKFI